RRDVRLVKLARPRGPEAFSRVAQIPDIEVRHLGAFDRKDAKDLARAHGPGAPRAARNHETIDEGALGASLAEPPGKPAVHLQRRAGLRLIDHVRSRHRLTSLTRSERA